MKKINLIAILLIVIFTSGCNKGVESTYKKPFVIVSKGMEYNKLCTYYYQTNNNFTNSFVEKPDKYNIGDTIK